MVDPVRPGPVSTLTERCSAFGLMFRIAEQPEAAWHREKARAPQGCWSSTRCAEQRVKQPLRLAELPEWGTPSSPSGLGVPLHREGELHVCRHTDESPAPRAHTAGRFRTRSRVPRARPAPAGVAEACGRHRLALGHCRMLIGGSRRPIVSPVIQPAKEGRFLADE